jgi:hypothetical protein
MKISNLLCILCALCVVGTANGQQRTAKPWEFLAPRTTHSGESPLKPGDGWLALRKTQDGWVLTKTLVKAKKVESGITDYDIEISSKHKDTMALFRNPMLSEGAVLTPKKLARKLPLFFLKRDGKTPSLRVTFNDKTYDFKVIRQKRPGSRPVQGEPEDFDYPILARSGTKASIIGGSGNGGSDDYVSIEWMGDIDRDGNLDLIIYTNHQNSGGKCVLLSSSAKGSKLFGREQCHIGSGC